MTGIFATLLVLAMLAVVGSLLVGLFLMARGGDPRRANRVMQIRVTLQGLAIILFILALISHS